MKYGKVFQNLKQQYTNDEIADAAIISEDLTDEEQAKAQAEIREYRLKRLGETTEEEQILSDVMRLRFQMEHYVRKEAFSFERTFGHFLEAYVHILKRSKKEIAEELSLHYTKLSRVLNDKEEPNIELMYRLEAHSGKLISASLWWKLVVKKQEFVIAKDTETRNAERGKVKNELRA